LSFVDKLEGEFSIIIYDAQNDKFVFARDSVGVRPLYYAYSASNKSLQVASELKAMSSPGVKHFPPGYVATVDSDFNLNLNKYHDCILIAKNKNAVSFATVTKNIGDALYKAVDRRMCSDVPLGCFLSGGLDSSGVAALAASMYRHPIRTFTLRIDGLHILPVRSQSI
jgi:asparagine synthase (glutamine-hydrolysing)